MGTGCFSTSIDLKSSYHEGVVERSEDVSYSENGSSVADDLGVNGSHLSNCLARSLLLGLLTAC